MKTSPGPGLVGSGSACTNIAADEAKMVNARAANMFFVRKDLETALNERLRLERLRNSKGATGEVRENRYKLMMGSQTLAAVLFQLSAPQVY